MYYSRNVQINSKDPLFSWCDQIAHLANNLYNAALFRQRQMMCASVKPVEQLSENEKEVLNEISEALPKMKQNRTIPSSGFLSYVFLDDLFKTTENRDYMAELPRQTAQHVLRHVCRDIKSYFEAVKAYRKDPSLFTGIPQLPHYRHKGGISSFDITNQDCVVRKNEKGHYVAKLPLTRIPVSLGRSIPGKLKEVHVTPMNGIYQISFVFEDGKQQPEKKEEPKRIVSIDLGVENLMAAVNNVGAESLLFKGGAVKSVNHHYNHRIANMMSSKTIHSKEKYVPSGRYKAVTLKRNNRINDYMLKAGKELMRWCVENRIDTIVIGENRNWKQSIELGKENNRRFVQIPYDRMKNIIRYSGERTGIRVVFQEESYTSKASFLDNDEIPEYGKEDGKKFSGKRTCRGMYESRDGRKINADLNGAANILRKYKADAFAGNSPHFERVRVIRYPQ